MTPRRTAFVAALFAATVATPTRADLPDDVDTLAARFRASGAVVEVLRPRFASAGSPTWLALPVRFLQGPEGCTTLVVLGAVSTVFSLRTVAEMESGSEEIESEQIPSAAGAAVLRRCGDGRGMLLHVLVDMRSPHGMLETLVASSKVSLPSIHEILPHRNAGALPPMMRPGPPPPPAPLATRSAAAEARLLRDPGATVERQIVQSSAQGTGRTQVDLAPGCHRFVVMGMPGARGEEPGDIDAQLVAAQNEIVDSDRTESPDATLVACVGEPRTFVLEFAGARPGVPTLVLHGATPLPPQVPPAFGVEARARIGRALLERSIPAPKEPARFVSLGVAGTTLMPVELETGQCYLAALVAIQGDTRLLSLNVSAGALRRSAHSDDPEEAAVLSFCAGSSTTGHLDADVRGTSLAWGAALWPLGRTRLGEEAP